MKKFFNCTALFICLALFAACASVGGSRGAGDADIEVFPQLGHRFLVSSVALSPDGSQVLSGSADNTVKLWDAVTGKEIRTFAGHTGAVYTVAFSPDGGRVLSGSADGTVKLWDASSGREIRTLLKAGRWATSSRVDSVAFSPDGRQVLSGGMGSNFRLMDASSGKIIKTFRGHTEGVLSVAFSPDGRQALSGGMDGTVKLWDAATGKEIRTFAGNRFRINSAVFSPDGRQVLSGPGDRMFTLWDAATGREIRTFRGHTGNITSVAFSPDGKQVLSSSRDKTVKLWDAATGGVIRTFEGHTGDVTSAAFTPDGRQVISGSNDKTIKLWDAATGGVIRTFTGYTAASWVSSVAFSPDGRQMLSRSEGTVKLLDAATGRVIRTFAGHTYEVTSVAFSPDGRQMLSSSGQYGKDNTTIKLWDVASGGEIRTFAGQTRTITSLAFSPDGTQALSGSGESSIIKLWDVATGREIRTFTGHVHTVTSVAFSPDGKQASGSAGRTVKLWDVATGREIRTFEYTGAGGSVAFSPDGTQILSSGGMSSLDNTVGLWDAVTGRQIKVFAGHTNSVYSVAFSPDGGQALSGSQDTTIKLWDVAKRREIRTLRGHTDSVYSVAFSPDGRQILSSSADGTIRRWDTATGREIARFISFSGSDTQLAAASRGLTVETQTAAASNEGEWLAITPDGYYNASPRGDRYLNVRVNNTVSGIDSYRSVFYNPDVVQARLQGLPDPTSKANVTIQQAAAFMPPEVTIQSPANFSATNTATTNFSVTVTDQSQPIKNIRVFVNGRSAGRNELAVTGNQKNVNFTLPVQLDPGSNRIEVIAFNGYSETRRFVDLTYNAPAGQRPTLPNLWILAVGVNRYDNAGTPRLYRHSNLSFAVTDATRLIDSFKSQEGRSYAKVNSLLVTDGTAADIRRSLAFLNQAGDRDVVLVFMAGHGITAQEGKFFFLPRDAAFSDYKVVNDRPVDIVVDASRAISGDEITAVLEGPGKRLLLIDACQSGGVDSDRMVRALQESNAYVFAASQGNESSYESPQWGGGHGVFTYSILNALGGAPAALAQPGNEVRVLSMSGFVRLEVPRETGNKQNPRLYSLLSADFPLAVVR